jgi:radical SAM protein with 4Fe4S-binding SPASM domain
MIARRVRLQSLVFEVSQRCNHACLHCYNVWLPDTTGRPAAYPRGELGTAETLALFNHVLDQVDCHHVTLTGGEPLLRSDLPAMVDLLRLRQLSATVISNGRLLDEPVAADLIRRGVSLFELPLLSHRREVHDQLSGSPGAVDAVLAALANIRQHRGQFVAVFVATRLNLGDLQETVRLAFALGARGLMLNRFNPGGRGRWHLDRLLPSTTEIQQALQDASAASIRFGIPVSCSIPIQPCLVRTQDYPALGFGLCAAGTERAYYTVDPLGNLRPCNHTPTILGNLTRESVMDLIASERMARFVAATPPFCAPCSLRACCQGGCKAAAQVCYGSLEVEEPFLANNMSNADPTRLDMLI